MSNVYVLIPYAADELDPVAGELITAARVLGNVTAVVVGPEGVADPFVEPLRNLGADVIVGATTADYNERVVLPEVDALVSLSQESPGPIVLARGATGSEIAGRLAARLGSGMLADCSVIRADGTAELSVLGETYHVVAAVGGESPIYVVRPGAITADPQPASGTYKTINLPTATEKDCTVHAFTPAEASQRPDLSQAKVVVAGGRGVGSAEGFISQLEPLADLFGGAVGATRDAVDERYYDAAYQIGQTGVTCSPDLYIGVGISGAIQHKAGMQTSRHVVCINSDADAPLFDISDFGVIGDGRVIVPELIKVVQQRKNARS